MALHMLGVEGPTLPRPRRRDGSAPTGEMSRARDRDAQVLAGTSVALVAASCGASRWACWRCQRPPTATIGHMAGFGPLEGLASGRVAVASGPSASRVADEPGRRSPTTT